MTSKRETSTYTCPQCRRKIRTLADEYGDHGCICSMWDGPEETKDNEEEAEYLSIKIPRKELTKHGLPGCGYDGVEVIEDNVTGNSRWSIYHDLIFRWTDGKVYSTSFSVGATEMQDESPWEYEDEVECEEVRKVLKTIEIWEAVQDGEVS